jgi:hypothetical protein
MTARSRFSVLLASFAAVVPAPASAQDSVETASPTAVEFAERGGVTLGELDLTVIAKSPGDLEVSFTPTGGPEVALGTSVPVTPPAAVEMAGTAPKGLKKDDAATVTLTFALPKGTAAAEFGGRLTLATEAARPHVLTLSGSATAATPRWTFTQDKITVLVTKETPWSDGKAGRTLGLHDAQPAAEQGNGPLAFTSVTLDGSGIAFASLAIPSPAPTPKPSADEVKLATLDVTLTDAEGSATGKLLLGDDDGQALELTVQTTDLIVWPLIAILLGALLGSVGLKTLEVRRAAMLARSALRDAKAKYDAAQPQERDDRLMDVDTTRVEPLSKELRKVVRPATLETLSKEAEQLTSSFAAWIALSSALGALTDVIAKAGSTFEGTSGRERRPLADSERLVAASFDPATDADASALIKTQSAALAVLIELLPLYDAVVSQSPTDPENHRLLERSNPLATYLTHSPIHRRRTAAEGERLLDALTTVHDNLLYLYEVRGIAPFPSTSPGDIALLIAAYVVREPTHEQVLAQVRRNDWLVYLFALTVSAVVYLLPLYAGKPWGSTFDYLSALGAGFVGTVLVDKALLPLTRSLDPFAKPDAKEKATA